MSNPHVVTFTDLLGRQIAELRGCQKFEQGSLCFAAPRAPRALVTLTKPKRKVKRSEVNKVLAGK